MPRRGNRQDDKQAAHWAETLPGAAQKELLRQEQINHSGGDGKGQSDQAFQQQPRAEAGRQQKCPPSGMRFFFIQCAQKSPHREGDGECEHHIGNQDARE